MQSGFYLSMMSKCFAFRCKPPMVTIDNLPEEVMLHIFQFLPVESILQCERVSRRWRKLATDTGLWRRTEIVCSGQRGQVCPRTLEIIKSHCKIMGHLKIKYILKYPFLSSLTGLCENLVCLEMIMCRIQVELEEDIKKWPNLKKLNLKNSMLKSERPFLLPLDHLTQLHFLGLSDFGLTNDNCDSLLKCRYLNHIIIDKIKDLELHHIHALIKAKQQTLMTFHLFGGESINDECILMLGRCPALTDLSIIRCDQLTDRALDGVSNMKPITHLQLWNNSVFSETKLTNTLAHVNLIKLQRLSLSKILNITGRAVDILSEYYTNLTFLVLYQCPRILHGGYEKQLKAKLRNIYIALY